VRNLAEQAMRFRGDPEVTKGVLTCLNALVGAGGFEPPTSAL
jgi:hypothetical protein